jgi:hypothetical protein
LAGNAERERRLRSDMEGGTGTRSSKLFMVVALVLSGSLLLGLLSIGGLVVYRLVLQPTKVATAPEDTATPTQKPVLASTPTGSPLPSVTPTTTGPAPTATLVVAAASTGTPTEPANGGTEPSSTTPDSTEMPETGFGTLGTALIGLMLVCLYSGARAARHPRAQQ